MIKLETIRDMMKTNTNLLKKIQQKPSDGLNTKKEENIDGLDEYCNGSQGK